MLLSNLRHSAGMPASGYAHVHKSGVRTFTKACATKPDGGGQPHRSRPQTLADLAAYLGSLPANPQPQTDGTQALDRGERWYMDHCSTCHLAKGQGQAQSFVPALRGQNYSYLLVQLRRLAHGHRPDIPDELLEVFDAMTSADMEAVADSLSRLSPDPVHTRL